MANNTTYSVWIAISVAHPYFNGKMQCGLEMEPDEVTRYLFSRLGILFRKKDSCNWVLITKDGEPVTEDMTDFVFNLKSVNDQFYYCTDTKVTASHGTCIDIGQRRIWKQFMLPNAKFLVLPPVISLQLESPLKFLEFMFIPRKIGSGAVLELRDDRGRLQFMPVERKKIPGEKMEVMRFVTNEMISLQESIACALKLWEIHPNGEHLLIESLKMPQASSLSVISPEDTITSYHYL